MDRTWTIVLRTVAGVGLVALSLGAACTSRRSVEPSPVSYRLYVGMAGSNNRIYVVDIERDSVLDSTDTALNLTSIPCATPDGQHLLVDRSSAPTDVLSTADLSEVAELPGCGRHHTLATEEGLIIGIRGRCISYVSYPDFSFLGSDTIELDNSPYLTTPMVVDGTRGLLYVEVLFGSTSVERSDLLAWDYRQRKIHDVWSFPYGDASQRMDLGRFALSPDGQVLYAIGSSPEGAFVFRYDLPSRHMVWRHRILTRVGFLCLSPDGRELWRTDKGNPLWPITSGYIYIHEPATGVVTDSISLFGYLSDPALPLPGSKIIFTPDRTKAYVAVSDAYNAGPILVIDVMKKERSGLLFKEFNNLPYYMDIGPAP